MKTKPNPQPKVLVSATGKAEHQLLFYYLPEDYEVDIEIHLTPYKGFLKRLWVGLKYAFGYRCKYGNWDSIIVNDSNYKELKKVVEFFEGDAEKRAACLFADEILKSTAISYINEDYGMCWQYGVEELSSAELYDELMEITPPVQVARDAMKAVSKDVRKPKVVREGKV